MDFHYKEVLETPDLQKIIENNTWLFGDRYETIGAEEDTFTKTSYKLREAIPQINNITSEDIENSGDLIGAQRQVDLFLARKIPSLDSAGEKFFRCVIIEIKRPSICLNQKHIRQIEDYASIISKFPEFNSSCLKFEIILIGRTFSKDDYNIKAKLTSMSERSDGGLISDDGKIKQYVKTWYTIFDEFELKNDYLLEKLKIQRENLTEFSGMALVSDLQKKSDDAA